VFQQQQQGDAVRRREERFAREHQLEIARQSGFATNGSATQWQPNSLARRLGAGVQQKKPWAVSEPEPVHDPVSLWFLRYSKLAATLRVGPESDDFQHSNLSLAYSVLLTPFECPDRMLLIGTDILSSGARLRSSRTTSV